MSYSIEKRHGAYNITPRREAIKYIVIHYDGNGKTQAPIARNNCAYFAGGNRGASAHYFIDSQTICEYADPATTYTWHCGDGKGKYGITNSNSIGIEVCCGFEPYTDAEIDRLAWLVQQLMSRFNVPANRVVRHYDASRKSCPAYYVTNPAKWSELHARITGKAAPATGQWIESDGRWWFKHPDGGYTVNGWEKVGGRWYLFDADGWMRVGWAEVGGKWYYLSETHGEPNPYGAMLEHEWVYVGEKWYYLGQGGAMATGWLQKGDKWYYLNGSGDMVTGWQQVNGVWYWLNPDGSMSCDTVQQIGNKFYAFDKNGGMLSHALEIKTVNA